MPCCAGIVISSVICELAGEESCSESPGKINVLFIFRNESIIAALVMQEIC